VRSNEIGSSNYIRAYAKQNGCVIFDYELQPYQLNYANHIAEVKSFGFYHGGDVLYELKGVPGIWHEQCLEAAS